MPAPEALLASLKEALRLAPDDVPIRIHLAGLLLRHEDFSGAEKEFRQAMVLAPEDETARLGLVEAFLRQGKGSAALALLEGWIARGDAPAAALAWAARALLAEGHADEARLRYREAIGKDPSQTDPTLEKRLGPVTLERRPTPVTERPAAPDEVEPPDEKLRLRAREAGPGDPGATVERPDTAFADVGGMEKVKDEIRLKIIHPLSNPELYRAYGKQIGGGILLYGPPGCGKTHLARATAGEVKAFFLSVGIHDVLNMYLGQSESNLHDLFELARGNTPCVLFFDEVDALAMNRADMRQSAGRQVINQFLSELDGVGAANEGILVLAATNAPWHLDTAFRRPGRFDRVLFVPPPDLEAREAIFAIALKGKPIESDLDYPKLAKATDQYSGADIKAVVDAAVETKLREALKSGRPSPLSTKDLLAAAKVVKPTTREWFSTARNYALYSNQGGMYDDILAYLK